MADSVLVVGNIPEPKKDVFDNLNDLIIYVKKTCPTAECPKYLILKADNVVNEVLPSIFNSVQEAQEWAEKECPVNQKCPMLLVKNPDANSRQDVVALQVDVEETKTGNGGSGGWVFDGYPGSEDQGNQGNSGLGGLFQSWMGKGNAEKGGSDNQTSAGSSGWSSVLGTGSLPSIGSLSSLGSLPSIGSLPSFGSVSNLGSGLTGLGSGLTGLSSGLSGLGSGLTGLGSGLGWGLLPQPTYRFSIWTPMNWLRKFLKRNNNNIESMNDYNLQFFENLSQSYHNLKNSLQDSVDKNVPSLSGIVQHMNHAGSLVDSINRNIITATHAGLKGLTETTRENLNYVKPYFKETSAAPVA